MGMLSSLLPEESRFRADDAVAADDEFRGEEEIPLRPATGGESFRREMSPSGWWEWTFRLVN